MSLDLQLKRGTTLKHSAFIGKLAEVTVDTDKDTLVVHDGSTVGGFALARESTVTTKAPLDSPTFTGIPAAPTATTGNNSTQIATTEFVNAEIQNDSSSISTVNKLVRRDANGDFSAGTITATLDGNASTTTSLQTARTINGVSFDGTENITIEVGNINISTVEFLSGDSRNGALIYGIEVDIGLMPNTSIKNIPFSFNSTYTYWIDNSNSYCSNSTASYPLNYVGNIGEAMSCYLDITNDLVKILTSDDKSTFSGKLVILYTK